MHRLKDHMRKQHPEIKLDNYGSSNITSNGSNLIVTTGGAKKNVPEIVISPEKQLKKSAVREDLKVIPKEIFETKDKCETSSTLLKAAGSSTGSPKSKCRYSTPMKSTLPTTTTTLLTSPLLPQSVNTPTGIFFNIIFLNGDFTLKFANFI